MMANVVGVHVHNQRNNSGSENEEVIEKLFPKCRPRVNPTSKQRKDLRATNGTDISAFVNDNDPRKENANHFNNNNNNLLISFDERANDNTSSQPSAAGLNLGLLSFSPVKTANAAVKEKLLPLSVEMSGQREMGNESHLNVFHTNGSDNSNGSGNKSSPDTPEKVGERGHSSVTNMPLPLPLPLTMLGSVPGTSNRCSRLKQDPTISLRLDQLLISPTEDEHRSSFREKPFLAEDHSENEGRGSRGSEVKLRESRIEIAGGKEIFSASRSKMTKKRFSGGSSLSGNGNHRESHRRFTDNLTSYSRTPLNLSLVGHGLSQSQNQTHSHLNRGHNRGKARGKRSSITQTRLTPSSPTSHLPESNLRGGSSGNISSSSSSPTASPLLSSQQKVAFNSKSVYCHESQQDLIKQPTGIVLFEEAATKSNQITEILYDDIGEEVEEGKKSPAFSCSEFPANHVQGLSVKPLLDPRSESSSPPLSPSGSAKSCRLPLEINVKASNASDSSDGEREESSDNGRKAADEPMDTDVSTEPPSPAKEPEIARVIGNVAIAKYEGSPRRLLDRRSGPKPPGYPQRVVASSSEDTAATLHPNSFSGSNSERGDINLSALIDISCDEVVKSILSIPVGTQDSAETSSPDECIRSPSHKRAPVITGNSWGDSDEMSSKLTCFETKTNPDLRELELKLKNMESSGSAYVGRRLATQSSSITTPSEGDRSEVCVSPSKFSSDPVLSHENELILLHKRVHQHILQEMVSEDRASVGTCPGTEPETEVGEQVDQTRNFTLSPETTDCDSNEIESEFSLASSGSKLNLMPVLEDGLSSGLPSSSDIDLDDDEAEAESLETPLTLEFMKKQICEIEEEIRAKLTAKQRGREGRQNGLKEGADEGLETSGRKQPINLRPANSALKGKDLSYFESTQCDQQPSQPKITHNESIGGERSKERLGNESKHTMRRSKSLQLNTNQSNTESSQINENNATSSENIWVPRMSQSNKSTSNGKQALSASDDEKSKSTEKHVHSHPHDEECDTDQETDRLLGAQRGDDRGFFDEKGWRKPVLRSPVSMSMSSSLFAFPSNKRHSKSEPAINDQNNTTATKKKNASREVIIHEPAVLIEGVLFRARYLGSTQLVCEGQPTKATRMMQAEEAVSRIKAPEGETQPSTEVDLFISTEKIMVLNTDLKEIMMDHALRTISYIADIGDLLVLMARRRILSPGDEANEHKIKRTPKMICHVFESEEAQFIAQSIGQAFQVAYMEFLKANGIEDSSFVKEMDYQEVLNSQEIFGNELEMFAKKEKQKEVIVPKQKGEILGMVIVESGWGSMLPTVVIANMAHQGPAARCGHLNIGDQIIAINGVSLVGLPLSTCQTYVKNTKNQTVVKLTVVPCAPVVEVKIKRPDTKYQLGFSVQNGVICSLLRGGIAERGGVRVGHRIIEINGQSVVAVPHERIVNLLATSVGEIHMKTMPTSMFRLLTGQENPSFI